jgi:hypothetical protein
LWRRRNHYVFDTTLYMIFITQKCLYGRRWFWCNILCSLSFKKRCSIEIDCLYSCFMCSLVKWREKKLKMETGLNLTYYCFGQIRNRRRYLRVLGSNLSFKYQSIPCLFRSNWKIGSKISSLNKCTRIVFREAKHHYADYMPYSPIKIIIGNIKIFREFNMF